LTTSFKLQIEGLKDGLLIGVVMREVRTITPELRRRFDSDDWYGELTKSATADIVICRIPLPRTTARRLGAISYD
jgi:hypothetical protein